MRARQFYCLWVAAALLLAGCSPETVEVVPVDFNATQQDFEVQVASIELLPLQRDPQLRLGYSPDLYALGNDWLLLERDPMAETDFRNYKLYRYDSEGRFLNAVGQKGERLDEIFRIDNLQFRDGKIVVFSLEPAGGGEKAITYDCNGNVMDAQHYPFAGAQSHLLDDGILTYYGHGDRHGREGRLMRYSPEGLPLQAFLTKRTAAMNFQSNAEVFIPTDKGIVVIDTFSDTLWRYNTGALKPYLVFDFGEYAIDGDFFTIEDMRESARLLFASQFAMVNRYMENGDARLVEFSIQTADRKRSLLYGYDDGNGWRWLQSGAPFEGSFRLLNGRQVVCLLEPSQLARISDAVRSKIENPEVLDEIAPDDNYVLARISFTKK